MAYVKDFADKQTDKRTDKPKTISSRSIDGGGGIKSQGMFVKMEYKV